MRPSHLFQIAATAIAALALFVLNCLAWISHIIVVVSIMQAEAVGPWLVAMLAGIPWLVLFMSVACWSAWREMVTDALIQLHNIPDKVCAWKRRCTLRCIGD